MTDEEAQVLRRENDYLKRRNAQLQDDVTSLAANSCACSRNWSG